MRIYTKTGDDGTTGLRNGERVDKYDLRVEMVGTLDELNCAIGVARASLSYGARFDPALLTVQHALSKLGSYIPVDRSHATCDPGGYFGTATLAMEQEIDRLDESLDDLTYFILPEGHPGACALHMARAVARRTERVFVQLGDAGYHVPHSFYQYLNRLSDFLFTLARYVNVHFQYSEVQARTK